MVNENAPLRLAKILVELNIGIPTIKEFLSKKGIESSDLNHNSKIDYHVYEMLLKEFQTEKSIKQQSLKTAPVIEKKEVVLPKADSEPTVKTVVEEVKQINPELISSSETKKGNLPKIVGNIVVEPTKKDTPKIEEKPREKTEKVKNIETIEIPVNNQETVLEEIKVEDIKAVETKINEQSVTVIIHEAKPEIIKVKTEEVNTEDTKVDDVRVDDIETIKKTILKGPKIINKIDLEEKKPVKKFEKHKNTEKTIIENTQESEIINIEAKNLDIEVEEKIPIDINTKENPVNNKEVQQEDKVEMPKIEPLIETSIEETSNNIDNNLIQTQYEKLTGPTIVGKIDLNQFKKQEKKPNDAKDTKVPVASSKDDKLKKRKRKRIFKEDAPKPSTPATSATSAPKPNDRFKPKQQSSNFRKEKTIIEPSQEEIQKQIKETLARLTSSNKSKGAKYRRQKRDEAQETHKAEMEEILKQQKILKVNEFLTVNDLALMMNVHVNKIISTCLNLGLFVSINQRLDAEAITLVADEFGFDVEFVQSDSEEEVVSQDSEADLIHRHPVVTVMGHVDHGKTSLLDYIRKTNVIAGEAGGITQHIGAYEVVLQDGKKITFLDTPGHEAFTAMRARGAKLTDIAIIVIAADDKVMPQTIEAINHARAASVPMVFAINKIDKHSANPEKIKEELSMMNILVEDWGGKFQNQEISAKQGLNVDLLLEKVLFEAEMLDLKANPNRLAVGTVIESSLEKGRGYVAKILIQNGTLKVGDIAVAGVNHGKVKAMFNERNQAIKTAGPSTPILMLGLDGAPQAGDKFQVCETEKDAKSITNKRQQLMREQGLRTQKHITLDEIGRRIAIGDFKELNIIVKGDVDGSIEALADSLLKLSTSKIQVNIIHKSVGQISESDVLLASASDAIIVGFQVRPSLSARKLAENEQIDIRTYSVIYNAIEEVKSAMEGMLSPTLEEKIVSNVEVREVFKITKVGTVAGCMVLDGKINRNTKVRIIRDGIVIYNGSLSTLKRYKDDVKEVSSGYECGLSIENFNDLKVNDIIEGFEIIEKKTLL